MSTEELFGSDSENEDSQQKKDAENLKFARFESQEIFSEDDLLKSRPEPDIDSIYSSEEREIFTPQYSEDEESATGVTVIESGYKPAPTQQDIFGEEIDVSSDEEERKQKDEVLDENVDGEYALHAGKEPGDEGVAIEIELPNVDESIGNDIYFVKLPNFLSIETKPFDPTFFEDEIDEDEVLDEEGRSRLKLKVENTIRWRNRKHDLQNDAKESNARIVRWSDGSLSLHMGNEIFDIFKMPIEGLQNHLFVQQGTGLQAKSVFKEKLTFRPHSTKSQTHLKMTMSIADRVSKSQKIRLIPVTDRDPEATRQEMTKKEDERMRAQLRRESQQRRLREKSHSKGLTANYLESEIYEDDEQELEESLAAIKSRYKKDVKAGRSRNVKEIYSDVDSDADEKLVKAKIDLSSEEEGPRGSKRKTPNKELAKRKRSTRKIIESDDDSE